MAIVLKDKLSISEHSHKHYFASQIVPRMNRLSTVALLFVIALSGCSSTEDSAYTIINNAKIWTGNGDNPWASAIVIGGDRILAVADDVDFFIESGGNVIDGKGRLVLPGFIDAHVHTIMGGERLASVKLRDAATPEEFARRIGEYTKTLSPGEWIIGGDWDHSLWGGELPQRDWIDELTPNNPVWVTRLDGHMGLANQAAFDIAGVSDEVEDVDGGFVSRYSDGRPAGIFKDNAMGLIFDHIPSPSMDQQLKSLQAAMDYIVSNGTTTIHHMSEPDNRNFGGSASDLDVFKEARKRGLLKVRSYVTQHINHWEDVAAEIEGGEVSDAWLKIGAIKGYVDGSLGSHSAAFYDSFTDAPDDFGVFVNSEEQLYDWIKGADERNVQPLIHAIGDKAINAILNIYERVLTEGGEKDRRFRIEHAQHIDPRDFSRFKELGVVASMQPYHAIDDGRWAETVIGSERIKTSYAFKSMLDAGATVAFGSDWFVAPPSAIEGIYAAVTRATIDGKNPDGWVPEQKISVEQAVRAYTMGGAYAGFDEDIKGSLQVGKMADLVILDQNLFEVTPEKIRDTKVVLTMIGGEVAYEK